MSDLENKVGHIFSMTRHGTKKSVILKDVTRSRVSVECVDTGEQKRLSIEKFKKFYEFKK